RDAQRSALRKALRCASRLTAWTSLPRLVVAHHHRQLRARERDEVLVHDFAGVDLAAHDQALLAAVGRLGRVGLVAQFVLERLETLRRLVGLLARQAAATDRLHSLVVLLVV